MSKRLRLETSLLVSDAQTFPSIVMRNSVVVERIILSRGLCSRDTQAKVQLKKHIPLPAKEMFQRDTKYVVKAKYINTDSRVLAAQTRLLISIFKTLRSSLLKNERSDIGPARCAL